MHELWTVLLGIFIVAILLVGVARWQGEGQNQPHWVPPPDPNHKRAYEDLELQAMAIERNTRLRQEIEHQEALRGLLVDGDGDVRIAHALEVEQAAHREALAHIDQLTKEAGLATQRIEDLTGELARQQASQQQDIARIAQLTRDAAAVAVHLQAIQDELNDSRAALRQAETRKARLHQDMARAQQEWAGEREAAQAELAAAQAALAAIEQKLAATTAELGHARASERAAQANVAALQAQLVEVQATHAASRQALEAAERALEANTAKLHSAEEKAAELQAQLDEEEASYARLAHEIKLAQDRLKQLHEAVNRLIAEANLALGGLVDEPRGSKKKSAGIRPLAAPPFNLETLIRVVAPWQTKNQGGHQQSQKRQHPVNDWDNEMGAYVRALNVVLGKLKESRETIALIGQDKAEMEAVVAVLDEKTEQLENAVDELGKSRKAVGDTINQFLASGQVVEFLQGRLRAAEVKLENAEATVATLENRIAENEAQMAEDRLKIKDLERQIAEESDIMNYPSHTAVRELEAEHAKLAAHQQGIEQEVARVRSLYEKARAEKEDIVAVVAAAKEEIQRHEQREKEAAEQANAAAKENRRLKEQVAHYQAELDAAHKEAAQQDIVIRQIRAEREAAEAAVKKNAALERRRPIPQEEQNKIREGRLKRGIVRLAEKEKKERRARATLEKSLATIREKLQRAEQQLSQQSKITIGTLNQIDYNAGSQHGAPQQLFTPTIPVLARPGTTHAPAAIP